MRPLLLALLLAGPAGAVDTADQLVPDQGTAAVALTGGDSLGTYSVAVTSTTAVLARPAVTNRSRRRLRIRNRSIYYIGVGSSTVATSELWVLVPLGTNMIPDGLETNSSGAFYLAISTAAALPGTALSANVDVEEETQSVP